MISPAEQEHLEYRKRKRLYIKISGMERAMGWKPSAHRACIRNLSKGEHESMKALSLGMLIRLEKAIRGRFRAWQRNAAQG